MDLVYYLQGVRFEWDGNKAFSNLQKHGVTFEEATEAFFDPFYQFGEAISLITSDLEQRNFIIGYSLHNEFLS